MAFALLLGGLRPGGRVAMRLEPAGPPAARQGEEPFDGRRG